MDNGIEVMVPLGHLDPSAKGAGSPIADAQLNGRQIVILGEPYCYQPPGRKSSQASFWNRYVRPAAGSAARAPRPVMDANHGVSCLSVGLGRPCCWSGRLSSFEESSTANYF